MYLFLVVRFFFSPKLMVKPSFYFNKIIKAEKNEKYKNNNGKAALFFVPILRK